jgi:uncharacterized cofD-like protein
MQTEQNLTNSEISSFPAKIVVIGGGHGLSTILRGLKKNPSQLTAIVTVADDGGSSGALRRDIGVLPPGDIRNCLAALSADEDFFTQVLQYRFSTDSGVGGHNLGNLLLTALANITGSFEQGIQELAKILAIKGTVTPSTLEDVNLVAEVEFIKDGKIVQETVFGESKIPRNKGRILSLSIEPSNVSANPEAIKAILAADLITLGPGSLYTSILPNLKVYGIAQALSASRAKKVYICNVTTQPGETDQYTCYDHVSVIQNTLPNVHIDAVICNNFHEYNIPDFVSWVKINQKILDEFHVFQGNLVDDQFPWRHDSDKLSKMLINVYSDLISTINIS